MSKSISKPIAEESEPMVPADIRKAFESVPSVEAIWKDLTPIARRDFVSLIDSAKESQSRKHRIEQACEMLAAGKQLP